MTPNSFVTVATCTLGDSAARLEILLSELRRFTDVPFRQVVCDDGTIDEDAKALQRAVCEKYNAEWCETQGGVYGISYAWNTALDRVETPWVFCVEDGLRPGYGWLETALDAVQRIGDQPWGPHERRVGMMGTSHIQDWNLGMAGVWPGVSAMDVFHGANQPFLEPGWNDGLWCWDRMMPGVWDAVARSGMEDWERDVAEFRGLLMTGNPQWIPPDRCVRPYEVDLARFKYDTRDRWPHRRRAGCGWYCGFFAMINLELWRSVGRFRDGCSFVEGHLGVRIGQAGHLGLCVEFPPWLHSPSLGFKANDFGKQPRDHKDTHETFVRDFGGFGNLDAINVLNVTTLEEQRLINDELASVELYHHPAWETYL